MLEIVEDAPATHCLKDFGTFLNEAMHRRRGAAHSCKETQGCRNMCCLVGKTVNWLQRDGKDSPDGEEEEGDGIEGLRGPWKDVALSGIG